MVIIKGYLWGHQLTESGGLLKVFYEKVLFKWDTEAE